MSGAFRRLRLSDTRGAAAVEFALVLPILLLLVFGIVDFARAYNAKISLSGAAREGARALALGADEAQAVSVTKAAAPSLLPDDITVVTTTCPTPAGPADVSRVEAEYVFDFMLPLERIANLVAQWVGAPTGMIPNDVTLVGLGVMRCGG